MTQSEPCSLDDKKEALARALQSRTFARSEQLKAFLRFICDAEALHPGGHVTEYVLGVEVLRRPEGYSPAEDSSVRTRAYELRQKLEKLYSTELVDEPIQIQIPKGTYTPRYVRRELGNQNVVMQLSLPVVRPQQVVRKASKWFERPVWMVAVLLLASGAASAITWLLITSNAKDAEPDSILAEAWGPLAKPEGTVILAAATPLALVVGPLDHQVYGSQSYPAPSETAAHFQRHRLLPADGKLGLTFSDNMLAVGTMSAAVTCANTLHSFGSSYQLLPERVASVSALRGRSAILLGAPVDSEAISVAMREMPLNIQFDPATHEFVVFDQTNGRTLRPKHNEVGDFSEVYGLLTVKTERDMNRKRIQNVLLSGITSVGIQGAAEFFSSSIAMRKLRASLAKDNVKGFPAIYQVVVRCSYNNGLLLSSNMQSYRIVQKD